MKTITRLINEHTDKEVARVEINKQKAKGNLIVDSPAELIVESPAPLLATTMDRADDKDLPLITQEDYESSDEKDEEDSYSPPKTRRKPPPKRRSPFFQNLRSATLISQHNLHHVYGNAMMSQHAAQVPHLLADQPIEGPPFEVAEMANGVVHPITK